jgi:hypothetical protein
LLAATRALNLVERPARGIARALADAPEGWGPPASLAGPLCQLLAGVADELDAWTARATGAGPPGGANGAGGDPEEGGSSGTGELYHQALLAARDADVDTETAAIASAIALDAQRISAELRAGPDVPPAGPFDWRSLFA